MEWTTNILEYTSSFFNGTTPFWAAGLLLLLLMAANLVLVGKSGWAWSFLMAIGKTLRFILRCMVGMIREVARDHGEVGGWDDEQPEL